MIQDDIRKLVRYGVRTGLVPEEDVIFTTNRLLELFLALSLVVLVAFSFLPQPS